MIEVNIKKEFKNFMLEVDFKADRETLGLLGSSGSGKSLTLKCIAGLIKPDWGTIILNNRVLFDSDRGINLKPQDRKVGYLFQDYALFPNMTVYENIKAGLRRENKRLSDASNQIEKILDDLNIQGLKNKYPMEISGGEMQRAALGRIIINKPEILLLDEPFSALDDFLKWKVEIGLKDIIRRHRLASIFVSHSRDEVYRMCDSICILNKGRSEEKKATQNLFSDPQTFSAALISGCKNFSSIKKLESGLIEATDWGLILKIKEVNDPDHNMIGIRSNHIRLSPVKEENSFKLENLVEVEEIFNMVILTELNPQSRFGRLRISIKKEEWNRFRCQEDIYVVLDPDKLILLKK